MYLYLFSIFSKVFYVCCRMNYKHKYWKNMLHFCILCSKQYFFIDCFETDTPSRATPAITTTTIPQTSKYIHIVSQTWGLWANFLRIIVWALFSNNSDMAFPQLKQWLGLNLSQLIWLFYRSNSLRQRENYSARSEWDTPVKGFYIHASEIFLNVIFVETKLAISLHAFCRTCMFHVFN